MFASLRPCTAPALLFMRSSVMAMHMQRWYMVF